MDILYSRANLISDYRVDMEIAMSRSRTYRKPSPSSYCKLVGAEDGLATFEVKSESKGRSMLECAGLKRVGFSSDREIWSATDSRVGMFIEDRRDFDGLSFYRVCIPAVETRDSTR